MTTRQIIAGIADSVKVDKYDLSILTGVCVLTYGVWLYNPAWSFIVGGSIMAGLTILAAKYRNLKDGNNDSHNRRG